MVVFLRALPVGRERVIEVLLASIVASFNAEPSDTSCRPPAVVTTSVLAFFSDGPSLPELKS